MASDRPHDDEAGDAQPELGPHPGRPGADDGAARAGPAEPRTRAEYYDALRAADNRAGHDGANERRADTAAGRSGWDAADAGGRPHLDALRVTPEREKHILDGDSDGGGGHRHGTGRPGKTEFPASWDDKKIVDHVLDVARHPDQPPLHQHWNDRWLCVGTRDNVEVSVVVLTGGEVWTAWPEKGSPGVVRNPPKGTS
jgi:hypothetical protein